MKTTQDFSHSNSILHLETGKMLPTFLAEAHRKELANLPDGWLFDWEKEAIKFQVFKLMATENLAIIQGLISLELRIVKIYFK